MRAVEVSTKKLSWAFLGLVMLQAQYVGSPRHTLVLTRMVILRQNVNQETYKDVLRNHLPYWPLPNSEARTACSDWKLQEDYEILY